MTWRNRLLEAVDGAIDHGDYATLIITFVGVMVEAHYKPHEERPKLNIKKNPKRGKCNAC